MTNMIVIYITCESTKQAHKIGESLLKKRLCTCINIFPNMEPVYWWPPKENKFEYGPEVVLLVKTLESKFDAIDREVKKMKKTDTVCVFALPVVRASKEYLDWIRGEIK